MYFISNFYYYTVSSVVFYRDIGKLKYIIDKIVCNINVFSVVVVDTVLYKVNIRSMIILLIYKNIDIKLVESVSVLFSLLSSSREYNILPFSNSIENVTSIGRKSIKTINK